MTERRTTRRDKQPRKQRVTCTLEAPQAQSVLSTGTECDWQTDSCALKKDRKGTWKATLSRAPGR